MRVGESEPVTPQTMRVIVGENGFFHFLPNHRFKTCAFSCVNGRWEFEKSTNKISFFSDDGKINVYTIVRGDNDTLVFNIRNVSIHTLASDPDAAPFTDSVKIQAASGKRFKARQLKKRWELVNISEEKNVPADFRPSTMIFKKIIYTLSENGEASSIHYKKKSGTWSLADHSHSLQIMYGDEGDLWHIVSLSKTELVLKKPGLPNLYKFTAVAPKKKKKSRNKETVVEPVGIR
jgi:hypothetical protein